MGLFKVDEAVAAQREAERVRRAAERAEQQSQQAAQQERERVAADRRRQEAAFRASPAGQARTSFQRGDALFQVSFDIQGTRAHVVPMMGAFTMRNATDVSEVLNSISAEGWDLHLLSTTVLNEREETRGRVIGTYVFTRRARHATSGQQAPTPNHAHHR